MTAVVAPSLSVVVPARDAADSLASCLAAVARSAGGRAEVIVVDDGSRDATAEVARTAGATVIRHERARGPAAARNAGAARARAGLVLFLDADVVLAEDAIPRVLDAFEGDPALVALFGSYDDAPACRAFVSDYRNLLHHFVHQTSSAQSGSFWAGCGAIRRDMFLALGGFDERYARPSVEDIELGGRLARAGHRVLLEKRLQGTHLKRWTLGRLVLVDVRDRAYPWSRLLVERAELPADLNLRHEHRASAALVWLGAALAAVLPLAPAGTGPVLLAALAAILGTVVVLNRGFYGFLVDRRGLWFALRALPLHCLYYAYASATYAWCWIHHRWSGRPATS